jgi:hypothetical protein
MAKILGIDARFSSINSIGFRSRTSLSDGTKETRDEHE